MSFTYRKLQSHEAGLYRSARLEALKNHPDSFGSTYEAESAKPKLAFEEAVEKQLADKFIMGAFAEGRLIGMCGFYQEPKGKFSHRGTIIQVYVNADFKGKKIGLHLLNALVAEAFKNREIEQLILGVVAGNIPAQRVYEQAGFTEYGYLKNYTKDGNNYSDERLMVLYRKDF